MEIFGASLGGSTALMSVLFFFFCFAFRAFLLNRKELSLAHIIVFTILHFATPNKYQWRKNIYYTHTHTPKMFESKVQEKSISKKIYKPDIFY